MSDEIAQRSQSQDMNAESSSEKKEEKTIKLYVKSGPKEETLGCCPFSQRLFMILWLKGAVFHVSTISRDNMLKIDPGSKVPCLHMNGEFVSDIPKCVEYIEAELYPPNYPKLVCKYGESNTAGDDIFAKFSAFVKYEGDRRSDRARELERKLVETLRKFDKYLRKPLDHEIDADSAENIEESHRKFIDGDFMTLADCNILPKLHIIRTVSQHFDFEIPHEFVGIHRYLATALECPEFEQTCPKDREIMDVYGRFRPRPSKK